MTAFICIAIGAILFVSVLWYGAVWAVKADADEERARLWSKGERENE